MADFATQVALKLAEEISRLARGQKKMTPRSLLKRFGYARRGPQIVAAVNEALSRGQIICTPPLGEAEGLDDLIILTRAQTSGEAAFIINAPVADVQIAPTVGIAANSQLELASSAEYAAAEYTTPTIAGSTESSTRFENIAAVAAMSSVTEVAPAASVPTADDIVESPPAEPFARIEAKAPAPTFSAPNADSPVNGATVTDAPPTDAPPTNTTPNKTTSIARPSLTPQQMLSYAQAATVLICTSDGHGSGFVVDRGGLVATARHVVGREEKVQVFFHDDTQVEGRVLSSNATLDYAFLRVPPCKIGFRLRGETEAYAGQRVFAVGSPRDRKLAGSVTAGVISNTHRVEGGVEYLQTDTSISPGNSGGPLIAEDGTVIGMNVWGRTDGAGLNFALPAAYFASALDSLRPQLSTLDKCVYCADCGFLNAPDRWIECRTWICCGNCGTQLGELNKD